MATPEERIQKHFSRLVRLIELEEREEIQHFREEFLKRTPEERELTGNALLRLSLVESHFSPAGHHLSTFRYAERRPLPLFSLDTGDIVCLSEDPSEIFSEPSGTVYEKDSETITVAFNRMLPAWVNQEGVYYLNVSGNRATYRKIYDALEAVQTAEHSRLAQLRDISLDLKKAGESDPVPLESIRFFNARLNPWQKEAVRMAFEALDVALVHGPPGTGKTTALIEIIHQAVSRNQFVFATAPSNTACDHLLECLVATGIPALRLGHPARIMKHLREHTLDFKLASHPYAKTIDELETEIEKIFRRRERRRERRAFSKEERHGMTEEVHRMKFEMRTLESELFTQVLREAPVMVGTHASAADPIFRKRAFDLLVMDEATQSTEPSSWIPILRAKKVILAGDHFQLPPTVLSKKAEELGLGVTLFERLHDLLEERFKTLLKIQYRMHEKIMNFSSREFYGGELIADDSVKSHSLADLPHVKRAKESEEVFVYLDTAGRGFEEKLEPGSESRYNMEEAALVLDQLQKLLALGVRPEEIAIISPYSAQVRLLTSKMPASPAGGPDARIEVDSVDGFQGREKEAVILSLVRSNVEGEMGFLVDTRRMNVAMTRARRKLIVIGDSATLSNIPFYRDFIQYAESIGAYRSSWEEVL